ncbi:hypothetical protein JCM10207_001937 [Rhodosporidiobolus poonsookiae]
MARPPPADPHNPQLFTSVCFAISDTIKQDTRAALHNLLIDSGATACPAPPADAPAPAPADPSHRPPRFDLDRLSHFVTDSLDFQEYPLLRPDGDDEATGRDDKGKGKGKEEHRVKIVSPAWVTRSYDLQAIQPPRFHSANHALFFSGCVICTSDFPEADNLAVAGAVEAFGGQFRRELTREVTHLICVSEQGPKYEMAMKFGTELGIVVVLPHWFEESLKLAQLVPYDIYRFPSPPLTTTLRDHTSSKPFAERLHTYWLEKQRLTASSANSSASSSAAAPVTEPTTATHVILGGVSPALCPSASADTAQYLSTTAALDAPSARAPSLTGEALHGADDGGTSTTPRPDRAKAPIFAGKKVYLASDLGLSSGLEGAIRRAVEAAGGACWGFGVDGEDAARRGAEGARDRGAGRRKGGFARRREAEERLRESDLVVMRVREGWEYWTAYDLSLPLGNLSYLYHCLSTSSLPSPLARLLHYPLPSLAGVPDFKGKTLTVSNYAGPGRDYVRALIETLGGTFTGTMDKATAFVVSASEFGNKVSYARQWSLPLVTHLWLEACLQTWSLLPPSLHPSYTLSGSSSSLAGASETHFTSVVGAAGGAAWTRETIEAWAAREEVRAAREDALRKVEELEEEAERQRESTGGMEVDSEAAEGEEEREELVEAPSKKEKEPVKETEKAKKRTERAQSSAVPDTLVTGDKPPRSRSKSKEAAPPAKDTSKKGRQRASSRATNADADADAMNVDAAPAPAPAPAKPLETPRAGKTTGKTKPTKRKRSGSASSSLSSNDSSSSSDESLPPSAKTMSRTFALISDDNVVLAGSKRGAAAKARAALVDAMKDRLKYEAEIKSSGKKKGHGGASQSQGQSQRGSSPRKKAADGGESGDEADEPEAVARKAAGKKRPPKEIVKEVEPDDDEHDEHDELAAPPPKKKVKSAAPQAAKKKAQQQVDTAPLVKKALKAARDAEATTQEGTAGAVSSFDNPPKAKPQAQARSNKVKIISTGLGLDKTSSEIKSLKSLGATWTDQPKDATHLVVKGISRTEKFLCCLPFAPKIVSKSWIDACIAAGRLVDEMPYLLHDTEKEASIGDTLEAILARAKKGKLFDGRNFYVTKGVQPDAATMSRIISACGGIVTIGLAGRQKKIADDEDSVVISTANERKDWEKLAAAPLKKEIYSVEAVFSAVLHQDLTRGFIGSNRIDPQLHD